MPLTRKQKEDTVKQVTESAKTAASLVLVAYDGLTVSNFNDLRSQLSKTGGSLRVVPKRLLKLILQNIQLDFDPTSAPGQLAIVWGNDTVAPAKVLNDFAQDHTDNIRLLAGSLAGHLLTFEEVTNLAKLPTRDQLLGQLLSVMTGPVRGLVTVMSGAQRNLVQVLAAVKDQKQGQQSN